MRGIERMVEDDRYCIDILTQIAAVARRSRASRFEILDDHVTHCVATRSPPGDAERASEKSRELLDAVQRFAKTT